MPKKSSSKKSSSKSKKKTTSKKSSKRAPKTATKTVVEKCYHEPTEEHRVFSHIMYILFLFAGAVAAYYTFAMWMSTDARLSEPIYLPVKALVLIGWAFVFKTFAHRIHHPHH